MGQLKEFSCFKKWLFFSKVEILLPKLQASGMSKMHGRGHSLRVERLGLHLAKETKADEKILKLFASLHDTERKTDGKDKQHGKRAADVLLKKKHKYSFLSAKQFATLVYAIRFHNDGKISRDPTIGTCWDADRLELYRFAMDVNPAYLSTKAAKKITDEQYTELVRGL